MIHLHIFVSFITFVFYLQILVLLTTFHDSPTLVLLPTFRHSNSILSDY